MRSERGQAAIEWVATVLVATLALGALAATVPAVDGRSLGGLLAHRLVCAAKGGCQDGDAALVRAYGKEDAELVRRHMPSFVFEPGERQIPVDWRRCRRVDCATVADDRDLDAHRSDAGHRATVFTRVIRDGGRTYIQYWTYYPDSNSTWAGSDKLWSLSKGTPVGAALRAGALAKTGSSDYPGYHRDDWEAVAVRIEADGRTAMRVTSHGDWQWCKHAPCRGRWGAATGWSRVSKGSHASHAPLRATPVGVLPSALPEGVPLRYRYVPQVPGRDLRERTATADGIRAVPLESIDRGRYRRLDRGIPPPWEKDAYENPESPAS